MLLLSENGFRGRSAPLRSIENDFTKFIVNAFINGAAYGKWLNNAASRR